MEKINIAELLIGCPKGLELYSPIFGKVYLEKIRPHLAVVVTTDKEHGDVKEEFLYDGRYGMNGECMLFPSKGKTTWEGFVPPCEFKDGDILTNYRGSICIYKGPMYYNNNLADFYCGYRNTDRALVLKDCKNKHFGDIDVYRLATEEEKQKLFQAIKENGYKWNAKTKTMEKLVKPKFKVGDKIKSKISQTEYTIIDIKKDVYIIKSNTNNDKFSYHIPFYNEINYELVPNKFDISNLKPFDKVLTRDDDSQKWGAELFSFYDNESEDYRFQLVGMVSARYCIPYIGNEHLIGKTSDCDEYYKNWK